MSLQERKQALSSIQSQQQAISQSKELVSEREQEVSQVESEIKKIQEQERAYQAEVSEWGQAQVIADNPNLRLESLPSSLRQKVLQIQEGEKFGKKLERIKEGITTLEQEFSQRQIKELEAAKIITYETLPIETVTEIPAEIIKGITLPSYIVPAPSITKLSFPDLQKQYQQFGKKDIEVRGFISGGNIFVQEGKKAELAHELGHYYAPDITQATSEELSKISREGRIALGLKYGDFFGGMKEYTPEQYPKEALAIADAWLMAGGIKAAAVKVAMPSTVKFIETQRLKQDGYILPPIERKSLTLGDKNLAIVSIPPLRETISTNLLTGKVEPRKVLVDIPSKIPSLTGQVAKVSASVTETFRVNLANVLGKTARSISKIAPEEIRSVLETTRETEIGYTKTEQPYIFSPRERAKQAGIGEPLYPEEGIYLFTYPSFPTRKGLPGGEYYTEPVKISTPKRETIRMVATGVTLAPLFATPARYVLEPYFFYKGTQTAISPEATTEQRILGGLVAGGIALSWGFGGYKYLTKPVTRVTQKGRTILTARDVIQPVQTAKGTYEKGKFILKAEVVSPTIEKTTKLKEILGIKPTVIAPKVTTYKSYTPFEIITKEGKIIQPANIITKRIGAKYGTVSGISGEQMPITLKSFEKLPKTQQLIFQKLAEQKVGIPVALKRVPSILGKDLEVTTGIVQLTKKVRITPSENVLTFGKLPKTSIGRTISVSETGTIIKEIPVSGVKPYKLYSYQTGSKDVTMPFSRATGKVPIIKGRSIVFEITEPSGGVSITTQILKPSLKSIETLRKIEVAAAKTIPKPRTPALKTPLEIVPIVVEDITTLAKSTAEVVLTDLKLKTGITQPQILKVSPQQVLINKQEVTPKIKQETRIILKTSPKEIQLLKQAPSQIEITKSKQEVRQIAEQILKVKQETKQVQKLQQKQIPRIQQVFKTQPPITKPKIPIVPPPIILPSTSKAKLIELAGKIEEFEVFTKKFGKEVSLGEFESIPRAARKLKKELIGTLRASGYVVEKTTGLKVPLSKLGLGYQFTPSKVDPFRAVQKRSFRLGTGGERTEILRARRTKSRSWI